MKPAATTPAVLILMILSAVGPAWAQQPTIANGGFEEIGDDGVPLGWRNLGPATIEFAPEAARQGKVGLRLKAGDAQQWIRQQQPGCATRSYVVSGWFRAQEIQMGPDKAQHARLYVHVHYEGRPYSDTSQFYRDIPPGTYDWRRFSVRLAPRPQWPISELWITVTSQFKAGELHCDDVTIEPVTTAGGASVLDWEKGNTPTVITDMSLCRPGSALADRRVKNKWKVLEYEIGPYEGKLISAGFEAEAPPVVLPLNAEGWHAVYLGLMSGKVRARLSDDPAPVGRTKARGAVEEVFLKAADLTGQSLELSQQSKGVTGIECRVAYVKLVPLTEAESARVQADRADLSHRRLATTIDGFSYIFSKGPTTREELLEEIEEYRGSDFGTLYVQMTGAEMVNYASEYGHNLGQDKGELIPVFPRKGDRVYAEAVQEMARTGVNPTQVHIQGAKALGMTVFVCVRPAAWQYQPPMEDFFRSPFYDNNPRWRCVDRDGTPVARMSYAVPEVRAHILDILREAVELGADGACVLYNRGVPNVLWEEPFCRLFQEKYGEDAKAVPESDARITQLRVQIMTGFMQQIRDMLDAEQTRRGSEQRLKLAAMVLANEADNLKYGIDVRGWAEKGLIDEVAPYLGAGGGTAREYDLDFFAQTCGAKGVPWRPTIVAWQAPTLDEMMQMAIRFYEAGAGGITFWDGNSLTTRTDQWSVVSRLGHVEELPQVAQLGAPVTTTLRPYRLGDIVVGGRYSVNWGF